MTDVSTLQRKNSMVAHTKFITEIACHPRNDDIFSTSSLDGTIKQWSMQDTSKFVN